MSNQTVHFKNIRAKIIETLETANAEVLIAVAWFTDEIIIQVLNDCADRGVNISIIIYDDKINNKNLFKNLFKKKAKIRLSKKMMHNKFCIIDDNVVINGSYNWTYSAKTNDENIQVTKHNYDLVSTFKEQFNSLFEKCKEIDEYFKSIEEKFEEYLANSENPIFFPCITEYNKFVGKNKYVLLKNFEDFKKIIRYEFNQRKNYYEPNIDICDLELNYDKIVCGNLMDNLSKYNESNGGPNYKFIYDSNKSEEYFYKEKGLLNVDKDLFIHVWNSASLEKLYSDVFTWQEKYPDDIKSMEDLKKYVHKNSNHKLTSNISLSITLYKIYYDLYCKKDISRFIYFNNKFLYAETHSKWFIVDQNLQIIVEGWKNPKASSNLVDLVYFNEYLGVSTNSESYVINISTRNCFMVNKPIFRENWIHFVENINNRDFYGLIDFHNNVIIKPQFDKIVEENSSTILYCTRKHFWSSNVGNKIFLEPARDSNYKEDIEREIKNGKIKYYLFNFKDKSIRRAKTDYYEDSFMNFGKYIPDYDEKYVDFYKYFLKQNIKTEELIIEELRKYIDVNNYHNLKTQELYKILDEKLKLIENRIKLKESQKSCYIATMVYEDINHPQVELLRQFRDNVLIKSFIGRVFIKYYYQYSPSLVEKLKNYKKTNYIIKRVLDLIIKIIK